MRTVLLHCGGQWSARREGSDIYSEETSGRQCEYTGAQYASAWAICRKVPRVKTERNFGSEPSCEKRTGFHF